MDDIELDNIDKGRVEDEQDREKEETSFTERTEEAEDDYDDIRSRIDSEPTAQNDHVNLNDFDSTDLERRLAKNQQDKDMRRDGATQILRMLTGENLGDYGEKSRELLDNLSEAKFSNKGKLTALKYKGEDV